ncbi:MAG: hypothetical protein ABJM43_07720 [Paracoccaceae bacterium]
MSGNYEARGFLNASIFSAVSARLLASPKLCISNCCSRAFATLRDSSQPYINPNVSEIVTPSPIQTTVGLVPKSSANGTNKEFPNQNNKIITKASPAVKMSLTSEPTLRRARFSIFNRSALVMCDGSKAGILYRLFQIPIDVETSIFRYFLM